MVEQKKKKYNNPVTATFTGIMDLFRKQEPCGVLKSTDRLEGKTVLVDGASSGLGFAIATDCAMRGARVIMACRSGIPAKGEEVKRLSGNPDVHMIQVDFANIAAIHSLVSTLVETYAPIDIFICNAGIVPKKSRLTPQGLEEMFMVNYFSKFILTKLLLEHRCFSAIPDPGTGSPEQLPRLIYVASESHRNPEAFDWDNFGVYREFGIGKSVELYGYYKLLLTTFTRELSRRLNPGGSTMYSVFSMCPGPVNSNIAREAPPIFQPVLRLVFSLFFRSPARAAIPVVYLATSHDVEGKAFDYLFLMNRRAIDEKAEDPVNGRQLWELSERLWNNLKR